MNPIKYVGNIIWKDVTIFGSFIFYVFLIVFMFGLQYILLAEKLCVGLILAYIIIGIIRFFYHKDRPNKQKYTNILERLDSSSFPSMHATRAILILVLFSNAFKSYVLIGLFVILTILIILSRYFLKKHYGLDLFVGAFLGLILAIGIEFLM